MNQIELDVLYKEKSLKVNFKQKFEGRRAFRHVHDLMPPIGCTDRVDISFSDYSCIETAELYHFLTELAADPLFGGVEINIVGPRVAAWIRVPCQAKAPFHHALLILPARSKAQKECLCLFGLLNKGGT